MKRTGAELLLIQVLARLGQADIREEFIAAGDPKAVVHGEWSKTGSRKARIRVNPAHHVVDTVIHELLHDLYPSWSENYVRNRTSFITNRLTERQVEAIYNAYKARVKEA